MVQGLVILFVAAPTFGSHFTGSPRLGVLLAVAGGGLDVAVYQHRRSRSGAGRCSRTSRCQAPGSGIVESPPVGQWPQGPLPLHGRGRRD